MYQPTEINELRRLLESGAISEDDLRQMTIRGSAGPAQPYSDRNALADLMSEAQRQPSEQEAYAQTIARSGYSPEDRLTDIPMNSMRNNETGAMTYFGSRGASDRPYSEPVNNVPGGNAPQRTKMVGYGGGKTTDLGETEEKPPQLDYSRPGLEIAGLGKGTYSKDGKSLYIKAPDGGHIKVALGYDAMGSWEAMRRDFERRKAEQGYRKGEADIAQTQEQTEASRATRTQKEAMPPGGALPQAWLEKWYGKAPEGQRWTFQGQLEDIPGAGGKLTESQGKAMTFGSRAANSHEILNEVGEGGRIQPNLVKRAAEGVPLIGGALGTIANKLPDFGPIGGPSSAQQQVEQAERDFINATLRRESGAVISDSEFDNARRQYFPQPGDGPEVTIQKKRNREIVVSSMATEAGPGRRNVVNAGEKSRARARARPIRRLGNPRN